MGKIVLLDDSTINKIAAGEVIERPASVVKEIVENSIDAGATNITVEIKNGGISYIRVTDNGKGIMQDDMEIAFERHATSKIRSADDLDDVKSMGFRGEALASIAEIAKVELISKTAQSDNGYRVLIEGGKVLESSEYGCPNGTTITIENLFFNTPVRYKFLKKDFTESGYIEDVITRIALVHPEIAIRLVNTGKTIVQTSGNGDLKSVIDNIYGKDIAENLINIDYEYEGMRVSGVIGKPVISRSNRTNQLFFVNKRYVKDKTLSGAAEQGFKGFITIGKHGFLILNIDMDPHLVDVNVHPAKLEVRFQEDNKVFKAVYHAIKDGLSNVDLVANTSSIDGIDHPEKNNNEKPETFNFLNNTSFRDAIKPIERTSEIKSQVANSVDEKFEDVMSRINKIQNMINITNKVEPKTETTEAQIPEEKIVENKTYETQNSAINLENTKSEDAEKIDETQFMDMYEKMFGTAVKKNEVSEKVEDEVKEFQPITKNDNISVFEDNTEYKLQPEYKYIGIAFNTYIIIEIKQDLYIIDQHAAHERIMYEKIKKNYYNENDKDSQLMLLPDIITLTNKEMGIYKDNREMFRKAGFMVDEFGENTIKLSGVPTILLDLETKELFLEALDEINTVARTARQEIEEKFIATVACKAAVKAHMVLERQEVEALLNELLVLPNPFTCPHGRPTAIRMTKNDIEKKFSRR